VSLPVIRDHTDAIIARLEGFGLTVGDAKAPADLSPPYCVVYQIPGGHTLGPLSTLDDDVEIVYQVTCVGGSREQAEWLADKALGLLEGGLSVQGRKVLRVALDMAGGTQRDDDVTPPLYWSAPRFRVSSTPGS
jgi:hypothetical protein